MVPIAEEIQALLQAKVVAGELNRGSLASYSAKCKPLAEFLDGRGRNSLAEVVPEDLDEYRERRASAVRRTTFANEIAVIRSLCRSAYERGVTANDLSCDIRRVRNADAPRKTALSESLRLALLNAVAALFGPDALFIRVVVGLGLCAGLRRDEMASLRLCDVALAADMARPAMLTVTGKGDKTRVVPLWRTVAGWLTEYAAARGKRSTDILLGDVPRQPMARTRIAGATRTAGALVGVDNLTPRDLRIAYATWLRDVGVELEDVQTLLGHDSPETTMVYNRHSAQVRPALDRLSAARKLGGI